MADEQDLSRPYIGYRRPRASALRYDPAEVEKAARETLSKFTSLDEPKDMTPGETAVDIAAGFVPGLGTAQAARDFERARREGDKLGMGLAGVGMIPLAGGVIKGGKAAAKGLGEMVEKYAAKESANAAKQRVYHGGTYAPGSEIKKPLFASPNKELASAYIYDDYGNITGKLSEMSHSAKNPANEEKLLEVANKLGIKVDEANVPLSLFDKNMYGQKNVNKMLRELKRQGYDSAEGTDIGAGTSITDKAVVLFPGTKTAPIAENAPVSFEGFAGGGLVGLHAKYERGGRARPGEGLPDPTLMNFQLYADTVSREMFPDKAQNPQRDAARHLLASALAAQKTTPGIAELLGKAHEFKEAPLRTAGYMLGLSQPRADYHTDIHNNELGVQLGLDKRGLRELLDSVEDAARRGTTKRQPGRASLEPDADTRYAEGGAVEASTYDPARVDDIVNQIREGIYG